MNTHKQFKVVTVSSNTNSFGLHGMILMAKDGEAWEVGASSLNVKPKGSIIDVPMHNNILSFAPLGFEIPRQLPKASKKLVDTVWSGANPLDSKG